MGRAGIRGTRMVHTVTEHDLRTMVKVIEQARREPAPCGLPNSILELTQRLIATDHVWFCEMEPGARRSHLVQDGICEPLFDVDEPDPDTDPFWVHYWDSKPCSYPSTSGDERTITTISDFYSQRQWHETGMYREYLRHVEHEAMMCLSAPPGRTRRLILHRSGNRDFDDRDRLILTLLRPHLDETYQHLQQTRLPRPALTARQHRILRLVADGRSNKEIGRELGISATTVRTHLEHIFTALQVTSRGAAVAKAFPRPPF
jgi:DNA-binding CsgD family transcriptional regulator